MKKIIMCLSIMCLIAIPTFSFAGTNDAITIPLGASYITSPDWNTEESAEVTIIEGEAGTSTVNEEPPILRAPAGSYVTSKVISTYTSKNRFIGYNSTTPDWSYASKYVLHSGKTYNFSASLSTKWGTASVKGSYKVGGTDIHIKANSKKASRMAAKSDVKVSKIQYKKWVNGKVVKTWTGVQTKPVGTKTNYVKYK